MSESMQDQSRLSEVDAETVSRDGLTFGDFPEEDIDRSLDAVREQCSKAERDEIGAADVDWDLFEKTFLVLRNAEGDAFDGEPYRADFYNVYLSYMVREMTPGYDADPAMHGKGAIDYDRSYANLQLLIEVFDGVFAVYMKDYEMGHIRTLGACVYSYESVEAPEGQQGEWGEIQLNRRILPYIEALILSGEINIGQEIYDYYHTIPDAGTRLIEHRLNDLVSVQEAAAMLEVSSARVKKMVADHVLDGFKRDGRLWLSKAAVQERIDYIAEHGKPTRGKSKKTGSN